MFHSIWNHLFSKIGEGATAKNLYVTFWNTQYDKHIHLTQQLDRCARVFNFMLNLSVHSLHKNTKQIKSVPLSTSIWSSCKDNTYIRFYLWRLQSSLFQVYHKYTLNSLLIFWKWTHSQVSPKISKICGISWLQYFIRNYEKMIFV